MSYDSCTPFVIAEKAVQSHGSGGPFITNYELHEKTLQSLSLPSRPYTIFDLEIMNEIVAKLASQQSTIVTLPKVHAAPTLASRTTP